MAEDVSPEKQRESRPQKRLRNRDRAFFSTEALEALLAYPWPGNVRELQNEIQPGRIRRPASAELEKQKKQKAKEQFEKALANKDREEKD